jgi:hypothetical protein
VVFAAITSPIGLAIIAIGALAFAFDKISGGKVSAIPKVWAENFRLLSEIISLATQKAVTWGENFIGGFISGMKKKIVEAVKTVIDFAHKIHFGIKNALKIQSPSKVMEKLGQNVVAGFNQGIESFGGIGVSVPSLAGASGATVRPTASTASGNGGGFVINGDMNITMPAGSTREQVDHLMSEIAKRVKLRGGN